MGKRKDPPKRMDPLKRTDPPKDAGGRGHLALRGFSSGSDNPRKDANARRRQEPERVESGTLGPRPHSDRLRAKRITVGTAKHIIGPAHEVLIGLAIPNDLSEAQRDLFLELLRTVEDLQQSLAGVTDQNKLMSGEIEALRKAQKALPVWRATWLTFIASTAGVAAGTVGASAASYAAGYTAGFIAGVLHDTFSPDSLCIMT